VEETVLLYEERTESWDDCFYNSVFLLRWMSTVWCPISCW